MSGRKESALDDQALVDLLVRLVRTPSPSYKEAAASAIIAEAMAPAFDTIEVDNLQNVIGIRRGETPGPCVLFNGHMDHVDPGAMENPYDGRIVDGADYGGKSGKAVHGRGASDNKGGVAAMIAAAHDLRKTDLKGTLAMSVVVQEEIGKGIGTIETTRRLKALGINPVVAVSCESTDGTIGLGHRGKVEFELTTIGRTAHASNPSAGVDAVRMMAKVIDALPQLPMPEDPYVGRCTSAITSIGCSPGNLAVVCDRCTLVFDNRFLPNESPERPERDVRLLLDKMVQSVPDFQYELRIRNIMPACFTDPSHPAVGLLRNAVERATGQAPQVGGWLFGTDGTFLWTEFGIPTIGFGPGHERFAHTPVEHVPLADLAMARIVYCHFVEMAAQGL